jgi:hypothetical protein
MTFKNTINYSALEKHKWYNLTLINPEVKYRIFKIPNEESGKIEPYIQYEGYLKEIPDRKFLISLPFYSWRRYINTLPRHLRELKGKDVEFEIQKGKFGRMNIRKWKVKLPRLG